MLRPLTHTEILLRVQPAHHFLSPLSPPPPVPPLSPPRPLSPNPPPPPRPLVPSTSNPNVCKGSLLFSDPGLLKVNNGIGCGTAESLRYGVRNRDDPTQQSACGGGGGVTSFGSIATAEPLLRCIKRTYCCCTFSQRLCSRVHVLGVYLFLATGCVFRIGYTFWR